MNGTKKLTNEQYDRATENAKERVYKRLGDEPELSQYYQSTTRVWSWEDIPMMILFAVAFLLSGVHIFDAVGEIASNVYAQSTEQVGWFLQRTTFVRLHQLGFTIAAEFSLIAFMVLLGLKKRRTRIVDDVEQVHDELGDVRRNIFRALAFVSVVFAVYANVASGLPLLLALMIPAITVGIGLYLESKIVDVEKSRRIASSKYREALTVYRNALENVETYPDYTEILYNEILQSLLRLSVNKKWAEQFEGDIPPELKYQLVMREVQGRKNWLELATGNPVEASTPSVAVVETEPAQNALEAVEDVIPEKPLPFVSDVVAIRTRIADRGKVRDMTPAELLADVILTRGGYDPATQKFATYAQIREWNGGGSNSLIIDAKNLILEGHRLV